MSYDYNSLIAKYTTAFPEAAIADLHDWIASAIEAWTDAWGDDFDEFKAINGLYDYGECLYLLDHLPITSGDSAKSLEDLI